MTHPLCTRIDEFRQQRRSHSSSLIISVFGDMVVPRGGRVWLGSLIRLLQPLGLHERLVRTSVFRLSKDGWLRSEAFGRRTDSLLTPSGQHRFDEASRHIYSSHAPHWDRRWRLILGVGSLAQKDRDTLRRMLFWQGFGAFGSDCFIHPSADLPAVFDALSTEGLGHLRTRLMPLVAVDSPLGIAASNVDFVAHAWNLGELAEAYGKFVAAYTPLLLEMQCAERGVISDEEAFLMRLLLIHDYRRLLLRDPELPDVLLPADWPGQTARALCKALYQRLLSPSERHLDCFFSTADGNCPPRLADFLRRFSEK